MTPKQGGPAPPPPPSAPTNKRSPRATLVQSVDLELSTGPVESASRIVLYGPGGIGKSTAAAFLPAPIFLDLENGTRYLNVSRATASAWTELRGKLAKIEKDPPKGMRSIVVDSVTKAEELATEHIISTRTSGDGTSVDSIEGFAWGKGWRFMYDEIVAMLADLDRIANKGFNVCLIAHDISSPVPNPAGEDFLRWEPNLYPGNKKGQSSLRNRVKEWADHVLPIFYDVAVKGGKGRGSGTRTIYGQEMPTHIAKSRARFSSMSFELTDPGAVWRELGIK